MVWSCLWLEEEVVVVEEEMEEVEEEEEGEGGGVSNPIKHTHNKQREIEEF